MDTQPSVDGDHASGHVGCLRAQQETFDFGHILTRRRAPERDTRQHLGRDIAEQTGRDRVDANAAPAPFTGQRTGKHGDRCSAGGARGVSAKHGIAVLTYDPIGQGERRQLLDPPGKPAIPSSTSEHTLAGVGALLVGRNTASYRVWDGIRSLDYLASRPEVDPKKLGCTSTPCVMPLRSSCSR